MNFKGKRVTVVGLGKSGFAAAKFLAAAKALVRATDGSEKKEVLENASYLRGLGVDVETGRHTEQFVKGSALVVTSPGVPRHSLPLATAAKRRIRVISEIELASYFCRGRVVGVTGSNGKTTTCNLIHRLLTEAGRKSVLCGNVGFSFLEATAGIDKKTDVVLELSSFQLEDSPAFRPRIAVVLNVSPNHLDRHGSMAEYARAKARILVNQRKSDHAVLNYDDDWVRPMARSTPGRVLYFSKRPLPRGVFPSGDDVIWKDGRKEKFLFSRSQAALQGDHNLENLMAAAAVGCLLKVPSNSMRKTFASFRTLHHRIEPLGQVAGVRFVNDSKSTTVASTRAAIAAVPGPVVLIAGGRDKGVPFEEIEESLDPKVKLAVLYGEARAKIASSWKRYDRVCLEEDFRKAVDLAFRSSVSGDTLLLSPMCASFDQFSSYEERGEAFRRAFESLGGIA